MATAPTLPDTPVPRAFAGPWTQRLIAAAPVAPAWVGLGITLAQVAFCVAFLSLFGGSEIFEGRTWDRVLGPNVIMATLLGYAAAATAYSARAQVQTLDQLRSVLRLEAAEFRALRLEAESFDMSWLRFAGWAGALGAVFFVMVEPSMWMDGPRPAFGSPLLAWQTWANGAMAWMVGRMIAHEIRCARALSRIGWEHTEVDLWDLAPLAPFVHRGLQSALLWVITISIFSLQIVAGWAADTVPGVLISFGAVAIAALVLPVYGVHRRIAETKRLELEGIHGEIRTRRAELLATESDPAREAALRLPALLALRQSVASVREWPFDVSTLLRFALYLGIGLASWTGSALVERLLGLALE